MRNRIKNTYGAVFYCALALVANAQQTAHSALPPIGSLDGLGVNIHFTDPKPGEMTMLADAYRIARMDFSWAGTERQPGVYDFSPFDRLVKACDEHKIRPLFILDYNNDLYDGGLSPHTDAGRAAMARWAAAAVTHFKGRKILWEMYNEPNIGFWKPRPKVEDYIALDKAVATAIRTAAPDECYFGAATSLIDLKFLEACFKDGSLERWDAVSVHPYRQNDPETAADEYRNLRLLINRYQPKGKVIPILAAEWGYSTAWNDYNYERQGKYLPRQWMTNLMNDVPVSIWYDWHDDGTDPKEPEHHFGSVEHQEFPGRDPLYDPKPSYRAARNFHVTFAGFRFNKRLWTGDADDYLLLFAKGENVRIAAWTRSKTAHEIAIPASAGMFKVINHLGEAQPDATATAEGLKLKISDAPLYLKPEQSNEVLAKAAGLARIPLDDFGKAPRSVSQTLLRRNSPSARIFDTQTISGFQIRQSAEALVTNPLQFHLALSGAQLPVRLSNPCGEGFSGLVTLNGSSSQKLEFAPGETEKTLRFPCPKPNEKGTIPVHVRFQGAVKEDFIEATRTFLPLFGFAALTDENLAKNYLANAEGDAKVTTEQSLSLSQSLDGPSPGGGPTLKLTYRFDPGWKFINVTAQNPPKVDGIPKAFGLWVWGDASGNVFRIRWRDSSGQTFQPASHAIDWKGWRYFEFPINPNDPHWGGANNGVIQDAVSLESIFLLDSIKQTNNTGTVYFAAPTWID